jgi:gliding motility-associated-like protein
VTDSHGCTVEDSYLVNDPELLDLAFYTTPIDCHNPFGSIVVEGDNPDQFTILINGEDSGVSTGEAITGLTGGFYAISYEVNADCRVLVGTAEITSTSDFSVDISPASIEIASGDQVILEALISGNIGDYVINWTTAQPYNCIEQDSVGNCRVISLTPAMDGSVFVQVIDSAGCQDTSEARIYLNSVESIYLPNIFSPNGDNINDVFVPVSSNADVGVSSFRIYNRWGGLVHEETDVPVAALQGWRGNVKGRRVDPGVFTYVLVLGDDAEIYAGDVTVVR